jgi:hypothetical protein
VPHLDPEQVNALAMAGVAIGALSLLLTLLTQVRLRRLRRALAELRRGRTAAGGPHTEVGALRRVAVVRYDAFGDMGGRLSFSAALLDEAGDGLVLTSINGRTETRTYAKGIAAGRGEQKLSPEEQEAISAAMRGTRGSATSRR